MFFSFAVCPTREDEELLPCPSLDRKNRVVCIGEHALCDRKLQCPRGEDEDFALCMFYKAVNNPFTRVFENLTDVLLMGNFHYRTMTFSVLNRIFENRAKQCKPRM